LGVKKGEAEAGFEEEAHGYGEREAGRTYKQQEVNFGRSGLEKSRPYTQKSNGRETFGRRGRRSWPRSPSPLLGFNTTIPNPMQEGFFFNIAASTLISNHPFGGGIHFWIE
jgi:hypothetical protein